ncbi:MAG: nucleotidyltransferase family protein [Muribaculaceae bacterium]|nr:nucleotidyltransferase family protein [Muribaculaceae bacterium]
MEDKWNNYILSENCSILDALRKLNLLSGKATTIFAVDENNCVVGSITDGDLRRSLISGSNLDTPISNVMHRNFKALRGDVIDIRDIKELRRNKITILPHLNDDGTIRCLYDFSVFRSILPIDAVLMAGGKGERLRPLTLEVPKPLLKIGDKCIIDYNIEALAQHGVKNISVTTNYLSEKIEEHFSEKVAGVKVKCIKEPFRMGTIGSLKLVENFEADTILVMNSDLLTSINYEDFYLNHIQSGAALSVATIPYMVSVPYAILKTDDDNIIGLEEKPTYNYSANAGIYLINRKMIDLIPAGEYFDATDLLEAVIAKGLKVSQFPINGTWIDIGSPDDFRQAQELIKQHKTLRF